MTEVINTIDTISCDSGGHKSALIRIAPSIREQLLSKRYFKIRAAVSRENPTPEQLRQAAENWAKGWSQNNSDWFADLYAPGAFYRDASFGGEGRGNRLGIVLWHDAFKQALPNYKVTIKEILISDNHATVLYKGEGPIEKPLGQLPPECNGYGVFVGEGDVVKLQAGSKTLVFKRGEDGHFDMSPLPSLPATGKEMNIPNGVAVIKVDKNGLMTETTEYYDRLPMMLATGAAF